MRTLVKASCGIAFILGLLNGIVLAGINPTASVWAFGCAGWTFVAALYIWEDKSGSR